MTVITDDDRPMEDFMWLYFSAELGLTSTTERGNPELWPSIREASTHQFMFEKDRELWAIDAVEYHFLCEWDCDIRDWFHMTLAR